uniref:Putative secreted protein n=1 Tax=Anopheles darlingi TaxID=43151 RepID=A0A2M4DK64_ANODA
MTSKLIINKFLSLSLSFFIFLSLPFSLTHTHSNFYPLLFSLYAFNSWPSPPLRSAIPLPNGLLNAAGPSHQSTVSVSAFRVIRSLAIDLLR